MDDSYRIFLKGREHFAIREYAEAIQCLDESNQISPHFKTYELIGEAYIKLGKPDSAIEPLVEATKLNRGVRAPSMLAKVFLDLGKFNKAKQYADIGIERDANNKVLKSVLEQLSRS
jgi:tetratricopeptide (TPR) repeat protein